MKLREFIEKWIMCNTAIRLWKPVNPEKPNGDKEMLSYGVIMEWEVKELPEVSDLEVIGITDILCDYFPEAVNIVVNTDMDEYKIQCILWACRSERSKERAGVCDRS